MTKSKFIAIVKFNDGSQELKKLTIPDFWATSFCSAVSKCEEYATELPNVCEVTEIIVTKKP